MPIRFMLAAFAVLLLSGAAFAQNTGDYAGYPQNRVRLVRGDGYFPDELYPQNRVIIRQANLLLTAQGMQIKGSVVTDFDADRVPSGSDLPTGQLMGVKVNIELYNYDMVLQRDFTSKKLKDPQLSQKTYGHLVPGQMVTETVSETWGRFGLINFELPPMAKPLAPGLYRLVARVLLKSQGDKIQQSFKWCSDMYGARPENVTDPVTMVSKTIFHPVMADTALHDEVYDELMNSIGVIKDEAQVWVGSVLNKGVPSLIAPDQSSERKPANYLIWTYHLVVVRQLLNFQDQLDNVDDYVDGELERKLKLEGATEEMKERWKKEATEDKKRIRTQNAQLIALYGGRTTSQEESLYTGALVVKTAVMEQVYAFQQYLTERYWCLSDGWLLYHGWHSINQPGYAIWEAIQKKNNKAGRNERLANLKKAKDAEGGLKARWDKRAEQWKYYPAEVTKLAFEYLRTKEEKDTWDADKFTEKDGDNVIMDVGKWAEYRSKFIVKYIEETDKILRQVTTTNDYCLQIWPKALATAQDARADVIALTFAYEYYIRTDIQKEDKAPVLESWKQMDQSLPSIDLSKYYKRGATAPGTLKSHFDGNLNRIKSEAKVGNFIAQFRRAIDAGVDEKDLPGQRPPGAPSDG